MILSDEDYESEHKEDFQKNKGRAISDPAFDV
jgi:hypothetical protein